MSIEIVRTVAQLSERMAAWRVEGRRIGMVPTMGALHAGHMALVQASVASSDRTVATLFVNPKQFGPNEDFGVYPRDEAGDAEMFAGAGVDLIFAPRVEEMYPAGHATQVHVAGIGDILEGAFRPGFFTGVATVVTKLLVPSRPHAAFFGEKDYQQLQVISRLVADLSLNVDVVAVPIVREEDGLALSSRNAYLSDEERRIAPALHRALLSVADAASRGRDGEAACKNASEALVADGFEKVDYITLRDGASLEPYEPGHSASGRVLGAAWLGKTRLIDNVAARGSSGADARVAANPPSGSVAPPAPPP